MTPPKRTPTANRFAAAAATPPATTVGIAAPAQPAKFTLRLDADDARCLERLTLAVSTAAGRAVDKSEVFRQLIRYADADATIGRDLGARVASQE
jgi:hypothetical protein